MTNEFKRKCEGIFCFLLLNVLWTNVYCTEEDLQIVNNQNNVPRPKLGEACWDKICDENQFCHSGELPTCQCLPGFKIYNDECVRSSGENEFCTRHEDCCGPLICINGMCRKSAPSSEFVTLAKICLGITVTTIIIAVFSSLIKCLIRYDNSRAFQRHSNTSSLNSILPFRRPVSNSGHVYDLRDEKPPSYEECIRATGRSPFPLEPPPYIISANTFPATTETRSTLPSTNFPEVNQQSLTIPLNVQSLSHEINSNATQNQNSQTSHVNVTNKS